MFGSAIPYIKMGNLENFEVNIPPIKEQKQIVEKIEQLLPLCDDIEQLVNK
jgi:type I restriction enzyme S subunit